LATLTLMAYEYQKKDRGLTLKDILDPGFQNWMNNIESAVSGLSDRRLLEHFLIFCFPSRARSNRSTTACVLEILRFR
jgi:hypothetical protein